MLTTSLKSLLEGDLKELGIGFAELITALSSLPQLVKTIIKKKAGKVSLVLRSVLMSRLSLLI